MYYIHNLNPTIVELGPITPRWYGLSYLLGFLGAYLLLKKLAREGMLRIDPQKVQDLVLNSCIFGVLIGGRLGYVLFYDLPDALHHHVTPLLWQFSSTFPWWGALRVMDGGMSAHGGIIFSILALAYFSRKYKADFINVLDASAMVVPIGLFFGRLANFVNGELYGHITKVPWAVKFPTELTSPTNNATEIGDQQVRTFYEAVGHYLGQHWNDLTYQQVADFLKNHPERAEFLKKTYGSIDVPSSFESIKAWIGSELSTYPSRISQWDIASWWQHSAGAFHDFLYHQFDAVLHPRHPSQIYEALLEGLLLFILVWLVGRLWRKDGMAGGAFAVGYPVMRIIGEQFRVGDNPTNTTVSLGVLYSALMLVPGLIYWAYWIKKNRRIPWVPQAPPDPPATTTASDR